jgi:hypothetical protein
MSLELRPMDGELGDIFWDLPPWITYLPRFELGATIYVANHTGEVKGYALMAQMFRNGTLLSEEALPVYDHTWFQVEPGDFIRLYGALRFDESDAVLVVNLVEEETNTATDSVATRLVSPAGAGALPPWPGAPDMPGYDWASMLGMLMPLLMIGMLAVVIAAPREKAAVPAAEEERRLLQEGKG